MDQNCSALVFDIYRGTTHDGPGIRSTVFFKGCPLRCIWCHNPEGISDKQQIWWDVRRCIGCGICKTACRQGAVYSDETGIQIDGAKCLLCLKCTKVCPSRALQPVGELYDLETLTRELLKDRSYYQLSGGGVTASGGEAMVQYQFVTKLFERLNQENVHTALDTCGSADFAAFQKVLPHTDCILYDLKLIDDTQHRKHTGQSNMRILDNFQKIIETKRSSAWNGEIWIRTPLIPDATATQENIAEIAEYLRPYLGKEVARWELCAFNNACKNKYEKLRMRWSYQDMQHLTQTEADGLRRCALDAGLDPQAVILTGILIEGN